MRPRPGAQALDSWVSRLVNRQRVHMPSVVTYECVCVFERGGLPEVSHHIPMHALEHVHTIP